MRLLCLAVSVALCSGVAIRARDVHVKNVAAIVTVYHHNSQAQLQYVPSVPLTHSHDTSTSNTHEHNTHSHKRTCITFTPESEYIGTALALALYLC